ncbi:protein DOWNSTREAM OF FLC-like [Quercus lobata]|uniref:Pollen-specific protein C13 n=1 Tax=Quercus lobata TaxID=97700 RepID=A0A7N2M1N7_QUELO|nr:protein DOWNSTREAM OF FLC-like [Quercus lobata]
MASTSARPFMLLALCVLLQAFISAQSSGSPFNVIGRVYCDTCRCGFETPATNYIEGAKVRIECRDRKSLQVVYSNEGVTDSTGTYNISVENDHQDEICESVLVSSPVADCKSADPGRSRATLVLTRYNGVINENLSANAMGFLKDQPLAGCTELLQQYAPDT